MSAPETLARETRSSIELTRTRDNSYVWVVKSYFEDGYEQEAIERLHFIDAQLRATYLPQASS